MVWSKESLVVCVEEEKEKKKRLWSVCLFFSTKNEN